MNLIEGLQKELTRNRELLTLYKSIGTPGIFGATMIQQDITAGEKALADNDVIEMLNIYKDLENNQ